MRPITFSQVKPMDTTSFLGNGRPSGKEETPLPERIFLTPEKSVISPILLIIAAIVLFFMIKAR